MVVTDVIRLLLFPALMAFAASSDLLTMTISNRLSLALAGGFLLLTYHRDEPARLRHAPRGGRRRIGGCLRFLFARMDRRRRCKARSRDRFVVRFRLFARLFDLCVAIRRRLDIGDRPVPQTCHCRPCLRVRAGFFACMKQAAGVPYGIALAAAALAVYPKTGWMPV